MTVSECGLIKLLPYILSDKYINIVALEMASPGNRHCASCIGARLFPADMEMAQICRLTVSPACHHVGPGSNLLQFAEIENAIRINVIEAIAALLSNAGISSSSSSRRCGLLDDRRTDRPLCRKVFHADIRDESVPKIIILG